MFKIRRVLAIGAHPDDVEMGAGGTVVRFVEEGKEIHYIAFSFVRNIIPKGFPRDIRKIEMQKAADVLGITSTKLYDYPLRLFLRNRQSILDDLCEIRETLNPDLILTTSLFDTHQDHQVIATESFRAFKKTSMIWSYELPMNNIEIKRNVYMQLTEKEMRMKINAVNQYKSEIERWRQMHRPFFYAETIPSLCRSIGLEINVKYAEAFEVMRMIW